MFYRRAINQASAVSAGTAIADLRTSSTVEAKIWQIGVTIGGTSVTEVAMVRPNAVGTASTSANGEKPDLAQVASSSVVGTAWSSAPTISGTPYFCSQYIGGTVGNGLIWDFTIERGIIVPVSSSMLIWNAGAAQCSIVRGWIVWEE